MRPSLHGWTLLGASLLSLPVSAQESKDAPTKEIVIEEDTIYQAGMQLLLDGQESVGKSEEPWEWPYEGVYRERGKIPLGYRVGGTSICAWSLLEMPAHLHSEESAAALERAVRFVLAGLDQPKMQPGFSGGYDVRDWGVIYALNFLLRLEAQGMVPEVHAEAVKARIPMLVQSLQETAIPKTGGWSYSRSGGGGQVAPASPFMTTPAVLALWQAQAQGYEVDAATLEGALKSLLASRVVPGVSSYTSAGGLKKIPGTIGRSPGVETVLHLAGLNEIGDLRTAVDHFLLHWEELEKRRAQTGTHEGDYGIAPYYFYYAHYYAALAIEHLPEAERPRLRERYQERLFASMEKDAILFNDRVFPRSAHFGTAMAMLSLRQPQMPTPAGPDIEKAQ